MTDARSILLVEDNPDDVELTLLAFEMNNIPNPLVVVEDGAEAVQYLFADGPYADRDLDDRPVLILLDLKLPRMGGLEVLRRLRHDQRSQGIPIVVLTSSLEAEDVVRSYELCANSYIRKPVDFDQFVETVRQLGSYWLVLNEGVEN